MPFANLGDYKFHYNEYGDKSYPTLVFLHAFTLDSRMWEKDAEYFSKDYYVITPDMKGHGKSDAPLSGYTRNHRVDDLLKLFDVIGLDNIHLAGLSYGGTTALGIALKQPERIKSLTLIGTSAAGYKLGTKISKIDQIAREDGIEAAKKRWIQTSLLWYRDDQKELREFVLMMMEEHSGAIWKDPMRGNYPHIYDLDKVHEITIPTKIIVGELDKMFLPLSKKLQGMIPGAELAIIPECGHLVNLEKPDLFRKELMDFLNKHPI